MHFPLILYFNGAAAATAAKSLQSCPTLCNPIDSPPGSAIPGLMLELYVQNMWKK